MNIPYGTLCGAIEETSRMQDKIKIYTYFHVREDTMQLYGFLSRDDLEITRHIQLLV